MVQISYSLLYFSIRFRYGLFKGLNGAKTLTSTLRVNDPLFNQTATSKMNKSCVKHNSWLSHNVNPK